MFRNSSDPPCPVCGLRTPCVSWSPHTCLNVLCREWSLLHYRDTHSHVLSCLKFTLCNIVSCSEFMTSFGFQIRMRELEALRLEVDSRRRTVGALQGVYHTVFFYILDGCNLECKNAYPARMSWMLLDWMLQQARKICCTAKRVRDSPKTVKMHACSLAITKNIEGEATCSSLPTTLQSDVGNVAEIFKPGTW